MSAEDVCIKEQPVLIKNARLINGLGNAREMLQSVFIRDGKIGEIGPDIAVDEAVELDIAGATLMPGLIDAHVHLQSVPGSVFRGDSNEKLHELRLHQLRAYLASGVTSVLDNAISAPMLRFFQEHLAGGGAGPRLFALAPAFYPPGGYLDNNMLTSYWGPQWRAAGNRSDVEALFEEYRELDDIVGAKVLLESGFGKSNIWPLHSPDMRKTIETEAAKRNLPIYIHAYKPKEQSIGLDMGVHTFVHSGFLFKQPTDAFLDRMRQLGTFVTTTLSCTFDLMLVNFELERLDDDFLKLTVPEELLETARNLDAWDMYYDTFFATSSPRWMPAFILKKITKLMNIEKMIRSCLENASRAILRMHQAGIPIVVGTDASSWPVFLNFFHGSSTIRELELLEALGIPPMDVISSATSIPAGMMGLGDKLGTIEKGKLADLIVVPGNPLENLSSLRSLRYVIKGGEVRTPEGWMRQ